MLFVGRPPSAALPAGFPNRADAATISASNRKVVTDVAGAPTLGTMSTWPVVPALMSGVEYRWVPARASWRVNPAVV